MNIRTPNLSAMATHACVACARARAHIHERPRCQFTDIDHGYIESRDESGRNGTVRDANKREREGSFLLLAPSWREQCGTCAATGTMLHRADPGQTNSLVATRIINLFPWQPRRDPHHWLNSFSHPRAITFHGRTANYRCRDTLHRSQHSIDADYRR